ncbi:MAG: SipW-dependent-type signal peptide-containing protein [Clostridia bacterium]|nr:SipW-dependent-type signal peptide-containing protein [Clostridia bacterium]
MNKKKTIAVAIVLALVLLIGGMLAFFTDTDTATNVFVLGDNIEISLSETDWDPADANGIHPGAVVDKNPVITNDSTTTPAYVFAEVIVPCYSSNANTTIDTPLFSLDTIGSGWNLMSTSSIDQTNKTITYVYNYGTASGMTSLAAEASTPAVFATVTLDDDLTAAQKATASATTNIVVNAYGIQIDNLGVTAPSAIFDLF